jgi:hypothetical protein
MGLAGFPSTIRRFQEIIRLEANVRQILHRLKERLQRVEDRRKAKGDRS